MRNLLTEPTKPTDAETRAARALGLPRAMFSRLLRDWTHGLDLVWGAANPAEVLAAMGTSAGEAFTRSAQLRAFLEQQQPGCTVKLPQVAKIKPYTINADGTVTINPASATPATIPKT
jgi:hypothetical protein